MDLKLYVKDSKHTPLTKVKALVTRYALAKHPKSPIPLIPHNIAEQPTYKTVFLSLCISWLFRTIARPESYGSVEDNGRKYPTKSSIITTVKNEGKCHAIPHGK